jgi:hypothetical protein
MEYPNFFEHQKEAELRLTGTIVLYDGEPVQIISITDHVGDGILRAYIRDIGYTDQELLSMPRPDGISNFPPGHSGVGTYLDTFIKDNPSCGIVRKHLSSPLFNKFRPFELGMYWNDSEVYYIERQPNRSTLQGLCGSMLVTKKPSLSNSDEFSSRGNISLYGPEMRRCVKGEHPTPSRCLEALFNPRYSNEAAAFHRHFALVKGPVGTLFLAYKFNVIGVLPNGDFSRLKLGKEFGYCKEVVEDLHLFSNVTQ